MLCDICPVKPNWCSRGMLLLVVFLLVQLKSTPALLPAPVNVSVHSINFYHTLSWDPGPGTPPGTQYRIYKKVLGRSRKTPLNTTSTSLKLNLNFEKDYILSIQASYNHTTSPFSQDVFFAPLRDTKITPLTLSVVGCGNCLHINISLPKANPRSKIHDIQDTLKPAFKALWRKRNEHLSMEYTTRNTCFTLEHLEVGAEYCVKVLVDTPLNRKIDPSEWKCNYTSHVEKSQGLIFGVIIAPAIIFFIVVTLCLRCSWFVCKPKMQEPKALNTSVSQHQNPFTPERTIIHRITIASEKGTGKTMERRFPVAIINSCSNRIDEGYLDRNGQHSLSGNSSSGSGPDLDTSNAAPATNFGERSVEFVQKKSEYEKSDVHYRQKLCPITNQTTGEQNYDRIKEEDEEEEQLWNNMEDVNLLSVTLSVQMEGKREMEEEDTEFNPTNFFPSPSIDPIPLCYLKRAHPESKTYSENYSPRLLL